METAIHYKPHDQGNRYQRWARTQRAERLDTYHALHAQGVSQRQAAPRLHVPRTTLQAWQAWQERLDACPHVVEFFESVPGLAFLHRLILALHVVFVAALHGLCEPMHAAFGQAGLQGNAPHTLCGIVTKTVENLEAFVPKSHVGLCSEGCLNSWRNSVP